MKCRLPILALCCVVLGVSAPRLPAQEDAADAGRVECLVLPVEFGDVKMSRSKEDFEALFEGEKGVRDYLSEQFAGIMEFSFQVADIVSLERRQEDYGRHKGWYKDIAPDLLVVDACMGADSEIDFSRFDTNGDGVADYILVIAAGMSEAQGGDENSMWPHQWSVWQDGDGTDLVLDDCRIDRYALATEFADGENHTGIGVLCHELCHLLGMVDLYDSDLGDSGGVAAGTMGTGIMDEGCLMAAPPGLSCVELDMLSLGVCETLQEGSHELAPLSRGRHYFRIDNENVPGEYYLIEYRDDTAWDEALGGSGLLVYHIDRSDLPAGYSTAQGRILTAAERWNLGEVNCNAEYQCASLVLPCGGEIFWPCGEIDCLSPGGEPDFRFRDGSAVPLALKNIREQDGKAFFEIEAVVESGELPSAFITRRDIFQDGIILQWSIADETFTGPANVRCEGRGVDIEAEIAPYAPGMYAWTIDGLKPSTSYRLSIVYKNSQREGRPATITLTTRSRYEENFPYIYFGGVDRLSDGRFTPSSAIPLRVWNLDAGDRVQWYFGPEEISTGPDGYWHPERSGTLRVVVHKAKGGKHVLVKNVTMAGRKES